MADILSQEEVDALLNAVSEDEISQTERNRQPSSHSHAVRYDFRHPGRVSRENLQAFQILADLFAVELGAALSGSLRANTRASVTSVEEIIYDEYVVSVPNPTSYNIIQLPPLDGNLILEFNPSLTFPIIDRLLGGKGLSIPNVRELTEIEKKLIEKIIDVTLSALVRAWRHIGDFSWKLVGQENDPGIIQIIPGSETVLVLKFELRMGDTTGGMSLCLPLLFVGPLLDKFDEAYTLRRVKTVHTEAPTSAIKNIISRTSVRVEALLAGSSISVQDLLRLQEGDIVRLDNSSSDDNCVTICVGGKAKFAARESKSGNRQGFQIVGRSH